jgi:hypothetical protein
MNQSWFLLILSLLPCAAQTTTDYFPLVPGSQWLYRSSRFQESRTIRVGQEVGSYHEVFGLAPTRLLVRRTAEGNFVYLNSASNRELPLFLFDNQPFPAVGEPCGQRGESSAREAPHQGPVGSFDAARRIRYSGGFCADAGLMEDTFVANLGLARRVESSIAGEKVFDLVYAQIGGVTYVAEPGIAFSIAAHVLPGERGTTTIGVRIALHNRTETPLALTFPSAQLYDFRIKNAGGETVYTWSSTRIFPAVVTNLTIRNEEAWQESFSIPTLPPGVYSVEGFLTNSGALRFFAATTIFTSTTATQP